MSVLNKYALQLNRHWVPVYIETIRDALVKVFAETAVLVDSETFITYSFEEWAKLPVCEQDGFIQTVSSRVRLLPGSTLIIVATKYDKIPVFDVKLTRRNLLTRDQHRCSYTGEKLTLKDATIDHVIPRVKGGKNKWENVVIASTEANRRKGELTPAEAGMKLLRQPFRPKWSPLFSACVANVPAAWSKFINPIKESSAMREKVGNYR